MNKMKWREVAVDPMFNLECFLDSQDKTIEEKDKEIEDLKQRIHKARKYIFDNYGILDKYGIELLDDILKGDSNV